MSAIKIAVPRRNGDFSPRDSLRRRAHRRAEGPAREINFHIGKCRVHPDAFDREQKERGEHQRHLEGRAGERDLIAEPRIRADSLGHHSTDKGERDRHFERAEQIRLSARNAHFQHDVELACAKRAQHILKLWDEIHDGWHTWYREGREEEAGIRGKFGKLTAILQAPETLYFKGGQSKYRMPEAYKYPMLSALRSAVRVQGRGARWGTDPFEFEKTLKRLQVFCISYETFIAPHVTAALDMACLDIVGKALNRPVCRCSGSTPPW